MSGSQLLKFPHQSREQMVEDYYQLSLVQANEQPFGAGHRYAMRQHFMPEQAQGHRDIVIGMTNQLSTIVSDFVPEQDMLYETDGFDQFVIHFQLSGDSVYDYSTGESIQVGVRSCAGMFIPSRVGEREFFPSGVREQSVSIACQRDFLKQYLSEDLGGADHYLRKFLLGESKQLLLEELPIMPSMQDTLQRLLSVESRGYLRRLHVESLSMQLICETLDQVAKKYQRDSYADLSGRDIKSIHKAHEYLQESYPNLPSIEQISRYVGINRNKLCKGFKAIFNQTIGEFHHSQRMQHAEKLLSQSNDSIKNISISVGYECVASFSTAFKRQYNFTPSEYRKLH